MSPIALRNMVKFFPESRVTISLVGVFVCMCVCVCVRVRARACYSGCYCKNEIYLPDAVARLVIGGACPALGAYVTLVLRS
jgi:hypothetical protein